MTLYIGKTHSGSSVVFSRAIKGEDRFARTGHIYQTRLELTHHHVTLQQMMRYQSNQVEEEFLAEIENQIELVSRLTARKSSEGDNFSLKCKLDIKGSEGKLMDQRLRKGDHEPSRL